MLVLSQLYEFDNCRISGAMYTSVDNGDRLRATQDLYTPNKSLAHYATHVHAEGRCTTLTPVSVGNVDKLP